MGPHPVAVIRAVAFPADGADDLAVAADILDAISADVFPAGGAAVKVISGFIIGAGKRGSVFRSPLFLPLPAERDGRRSELARALVAVEYKAKGGFIRFIGVSLGA
jgi:hypothetical protein